MFHCGAEFNSDKSKCSSLWSYFRGMKNLLVFCFFLSGWGLWAQEVPVFQGKVVYSIVPPAELPHLASQMPSTMILYFKGNDVRTVVPSADSTQPAAILLAIAEDRKVYIFSEGNKSGLTLSAHDNWKMAGGLKKSDVDEVADGTPCAAVTGFLETGNGIRIDVKGCSDPQWEIAPKADYRTGNQILNGIPAGLQYMPLGMDIVQTIGLQKITFHIERLSLEPGVLEEALFALPTDITFEAIKR